LLLASPLSHAQIQKSLIGFQGTPWGSSIAAVKAKFPNAKESDFCKLMAGTSNNYQSLKKRMADSNSNCISLNIDNYQIEGTKFYVEFTFDPQGRLTYVTLNYTNKQSENANYVADCTSVYNRITHLLESRYGDAMIVTNADDFGKDYTSYAVKGWSPLPSEVWVANLSGDKFINKIATELNKPVLDVCKVRINYSRKVPSEAYKL
jgi:uncharacterized protein YxeA